MVKMKKLACMSGHCDGAHCGLSDWYPEIEAGIKSALKRGKRSRWTTDWYSSKKAIASACITHDDGELKVEVSVSDDLDTDGHGEVTIPHTTSLRKLEAAICAAWERAEGDQRDNATYVGFSILRDERWVETYIAPIGFAADDLQRPPGDFYQKWGFQGESRIPKAIKDKVQEWIDAYGFENEQPPFSYKGWTIKVWS